MKKFGIDSYNIETVIDLLVVEAIKKYKKRELVAGALGISSRTLSNRAHKMGYKDFKSMRKKILRKKS